MTKRRSAAREAPHEELPPIRYRTFVRAAPARVWSALATGDGWSRWFTRRAEIEPRSGGRYRLEWESFGAERTTLTLEGPVVEWTEDEAFAFRWGSGESETLVRLEIRPRGAGTIVTVTETGYSRSDRDLLASLQCASGWGEALTLLKFWLEHGVTYGETPPVPGRTES
jgi:uncharacterized protein YndB with AHSA1/START domain